MKRLALILLFTIPAGWLAGRASFEKRTAHEFEQREAAEAMAGVRAASSIRDRAPNPTAADYLALVKADQQRDTRSVSYSESMDRRVADWTNEEFAKAMDEAMRDAILLQSPSRSASISVRSSYHTELLRAWLAKDIDGALSWFHAIPSTKTKREIADEIGTIWPVEKGNLALEFLDQNHKLLMWQVESQMVGRALEHAALNGPTAVSGVLQTLQDKRYQCFLHSPEFPEDFDFASLARIEAFRLAAREDLADSLLTTWFTRDADAAFDWVLEQLGAKELPNILPFHDRDSLSRAGRKFVRLTEDQRVDFMKTAIGDLGSEPILKLAQAITEPQMREDTLILALQGVFTGDARAAMEVMEASFPPERRLELLEKLTSVQDDNRFSEDDRAEEEVRQALQKCTQDEARINAIINRLKP